jgi:hypothetical protein
MGKVASDGTGNANIFFAGFMGALKLSARNERPVSLSKV